MSICQCFCGCDRIAFQLVSECSEEQVEAEDHDYNICPTCIAQLQHGRSRDRVYGEVEE